MPDGITRTNSFVGLNWTDQIIHDSETMLPHIWWYYQRYRHTETMRDWQRVEVASKDSTHIGSSIYVQGFTTNVFLEGVEIDQKETQKKRLLLILSTFRLVVGLI